MRIALAHQTTFADTADIAFDAAQPCIVFIHGALNDHTVWRAQTQALTQRGYTVLAPDLPGHGLSSGPALESIEAMADWLLALLRHLEVKQALLVGHSMGALIALQAAHQAPELVHGLALLGATYPMRVSGALLENARDDEAAAIGMVARWSHSDQASSTLIAEATQLMQALAARNPAQLLYTDLNACNAYADGIAAAEALRCPVLLLCGRQDQMTPLRSTSKLRAALPDALCIELDAGHALMSEQADAVTQALSHFAAGIVFLGDPQ